MANKVLLKKSSVGSRIPTTSDLDYGELAINYADGKLYYKTSSNTIKSFTEDSSVVTLTGTQTLSNKTLNSPQVTGDITASGDVLGSYLRSTNSSGDEGGEILLYKPQTNTAISGTGVTIDVYQNKIRFFEQGGTARGAYIDISAAGAGVGSNLLSGGGGGSSGYSDLVEVGQTGISTSTSISSISATTYRGAKYTIQITNGTAYAMYEFFVMHDGTSIYFPYSSNAYAGDTNGNYQNYFHGDYLDSIATTKIQVGNTYHALNWAVTGGNLVFSASCSSGTISVKGAVLLIKA
jgi:hypothetical protein